MRRQISWLVAATTSAVVLAFLVPLALLVRTLAVDRALAGANQEAQQVSALVAGVDEAKQLAELVALVDQGSALSTSVWLPDGTMVGLPTGSAAATPGTAELARARKGEAFTTIEDDRGAQVYLPVITARGTAVVRTLVPVAELYRGLSRAWITLAGLGALLLAGALVAADRMSRRVSAPIMAVSRIAHRLREGELSARAQVRGPVEVVDLASSVNRLAERIGELLRVEREAVADLSHRLRTPVTALRLDADSVAEPEVRERLTGHVEHLQRTIDAIVRDARRPVVSPVARFCDAAVVVRERVTFWSALATDQGRAVDVELPDRPMPAGIDAAELAAVLDVLLDNVFAHTPEGSGFAVALTLDGVGAVRLDVVDAGPGLADPALAERGVSGTGSTGLGLDIVRRAAMAAGGGLVLGRAAGGGTAVTVTLAPAAG
jgi:signal transduction histidine kinase